MLRVWMNFPHCVKVVSAGVTSSDVWISLGPYKTKSKQIHTLPRRCYLSEMSNTRFC